MSNEAIKPCAHCGGNAELHTHSAHALVSCDKCHVRTSPYGYVMDALQDREAANALAIAAWNRRTAHVEQGGAVVGYDSASERLRSLLKQRRAAIISANASNLSTLYKIEQAIIAHVVATADTHPAPVAPVPEAQVAWTDANDICQVPPEGWYCTRKAGHDGPCAAHQHEPDRELDADDHAAIAQGMARIKAGTSTPQPVASIGDDAEPSPFHRAKEPGTINTPEFRNLIGAHVSFHGQFWRDLIDFIDARTAAPAVAEGYAHMSDFDALRNAGRDSRSVVIHKDQHHNMVPIYLAAPQPPAAVAPEPGEIAKELEAAYKSIRHEVYSFGPSEYQQEQIVKKAWARMEAAVAAVQSSAPAPDAGVRDALTTRFLHADGAAQDEPKVSADKLYFWRAGWNAYHYALKSSPPAQSVALSDDEIWAVYNALYDQSSEIDFARAIEANVIARISGKGAM